MGNIERTECVEHGAANMIGRRCHAWVGPYVLCLRDGVTVEYVPASQLAGAVEALRVYGQHEAGCDLRVYPQDDDARCTCGLNAALALYGGQ